MREIELLTRVAKQHRTFVSNLTQQPDLKWTALGDLYRMEDKTRFSLKLSLIHISEPTRH